MNYKFLSTTDFSMGCGHELETGDYYSPEYEECKDCYLSSLYEETQAHLKTLSNVYGKCPDCGYEMQDGDTVYYIDKKLYCECCYEEHLDLAEVPNLEDYYQNKADEEAFERHRELD